MPGTTLVRSTKSRRSDGSSSSTRSAAKRASSSSTASSAVGSSGLTRGRGTPLLRPSASTPPANPHCADGFSPPGQHLRVFHSAPPTGTAPRRPATTGRPRGPRPAARPAAPPGSRQHLSATDENQLWTSLSCQYEVHDPLQPGRAQRLSAVEHHETGQILSRMTTNGGLDDVFKQTLFGRPPQRHPGPRDPGCRDSQLRTRRARPEPGGAATTITRSPGRAWGRRSTDSRNHQPSASSDPGGAELRSWRHTLDT